MRVLLVLPSGGRSLGYPSLGLGYLSTVLTKIGHHVRVIDFTVDESWSSSDDGYSLVGGIERQVPGEENNCRGSDIEDEEFVDSLLSPAVQSFHPELVGIQVHCANVFLAIRTARWLIRRNINVVLGGPEVADKCEYLLHELPGLLGVITGEGEQSLAILVERLNSPGHSTSFRDVPNFSFCESGKTVRPSLHTAVRLNDLPFPQWDLFDIPSYRRYNGQLVLPAQLSRGCRFRCTFCSTPHFQTFRTRTIESFVQELRNDIANWGCRVFRFGDSTFNFDRSVCMETCDAIGELGSEIRWGAYARPDDIDGRMAQAFHTSGCHYLYLGVESGNTRILGLMKKTCDRNRIVEAITSLRKNGIRVMCSFVVGFPGESRETLLDTKELIHLIRPDVGFAFPFESRDHTAALSLFSTFGPEHEHLGYLSKGSHAHSGRREEILTSKYGRLLAREFVSWQNTNVSMNWLDILDAARELQSIIDQYAKYSSEAGLIREAAREFE